MTQRYQDPLDHVWLQAAARVGLVVERSDEVYAATDGRAVLRIGAPGTLDADDCLAQMIFHELCHSLVEGPDSFRKPDWGLDNTGPRDEIREHACLRVQAHLCRRFGLSSLLAPTTEYRAYWDRLPDDPLSPRRDPAVTWAILGLQRVARPPWGPHLERALEATAAIARQAAAFAGDATSLYVGVGPAPAPHPAGLPATARARAGRCGTCGWRDADGSCQQADGAGVEAAWPACARFEPRFTCQDCGACCRAAYHSVTIDRDDPVIALHPELVVERETYVEIRRAGDRCAALGGGGDPGEPYACSIYPGRPRPCREFELGSENCLIARRRVGLSL